MIVAVHLGRVRAPNRSVDREKGSPAYRVELRPARTSGQTRQRTEMASRDGFRLSHTFLANEVASLSGHALLAARGGHAVALLGGARRLLACCAELNALAARGDDGAMRLPYWVVVRLWLPIFTLGSLPADTAAWNSELWRTFIDPACFDGALAIIIDLIDQPGRSYSLSGLAIAVYVAHGRARSTMARDAYEAAFVLHAAHLLPAGARACSS